MCECESVSKKGTERGKEREGRREREKKREGRREREKKGTRRRERRVDVVFQMKPGNVSRT